MKFGNMNGAKGLNCPALSNESTRDGKNEIERAMTREWCFISPSRLDNKSRMRRESHVRFCERWGVKLPLPTRLLDLYFTDKWIPNYHLQNYSHNPYFLGSFGMLDRPHAKHLQNNNHIDIRVVYYYFRTIMKYLLLHFLKCGRQAEYVRQDPI